MTLDRNLSLGEFMDKFVSKSPAGCKLIEIACEGKIREERTDLLKLKILVYCTYRDIQNSETLLTLSCVKKATQD